MYYLVSILEVFGYDMDTTEVVANVNLNDIWVVKLVTLIFTLATSLLTRVYF